MWVTIARFHQPKEQGVYEKISHIRNAGNNMDISNRQLAKQYGFDESTVRQWIDKGMPTDTDANARSWIVEHIIVPLRNTDTREQIDRERLMKLTAERQLAEIELNEKYGVLISTRYVEDVLTEYLYTIKTAIRAIPNKTYLELFAQTDAKDLRDLLRNEIDLVLYNLGSMEFELQEEHTDDYEQTETNEDITGSNTDDTAAEDSENK